VHAQLSGARRANSPYARMSDCAGPGNCQNVMMQSALRRLRWRRGRTWLRSRAASARSAANRCAARNLVLLPIIRTTHSQRRSLPGEAGVAPVGVDDQKHENSSAKVRLLLRIEGGFKARENPCGSPPMSLATGDCVLLRQVYSRVRSACLFAANSRACLTDPSWAQGHRVRAFVDPDRVRGYDSVWNLRDVRGRSGCRDGRFHNFVAPSP
jgi:hypothetical protein